MNPLSLLKKGRAFKDMAARLNMAQLFEGTPKRRTFKDAAVRPSAYKLLATGTSPKYSAGRRPSPSCSDAEPPTAQTSLFEPGPSVTPPDDTVKPAEPAATPSSSPFAQEPKKEADKESKTSKKPSTHETWKQITHVYKRWVQRIVFGRKGRPVHRPTVQTELALEKVTVLKNDLNEDNLEVVLVERKVGTGGKPLARLSKMEMTGEAWFRLTAPFRKKNSESAISPKEDKTGSRGERAGLTA
jgi:hypothetical protein